MPTAKSLAYDDPVYQVPDIAKGSTTVGANGVGQKFAAFTAMQIRNVIYRANTNSTSATTPLLYSISGASTATQTLSAVGSAATTVYTNALATAITLVQGDVYYMTHGTDATVSLSYAIEAYPTPGASVTCP